MTSDGALSSASPRPSAVTPSAVPGARTPGAAAAASSGPASGALASGAPVSSAPVSAAPVSAAPVSAAPVSAAPASAARSGAQPVAPSTGPVLAGSGVDDYVTLLEDRLVARVVPSVEPRVVVLRCLSGLATFALAEKLSGAHIVGVDEHEAALTVARRRAAGLADAVVDYVRASPRKTELPTAAFSHACALALPWDAPSRAPVLAELLRLLAPHGQGVVAVPVKGAFVELFDFLRELAVRRDLHELASRVDAADAALPSPEAVGAELSAAGLEYVDVEAHRAALLYEQGATFARDPAMRALVFPELARLVGASLPRDALAYVEQAVDRYFEGGPFDLTVHLAVVAGRKP